MTKVEILQMQKRVASKMMSATALLLISAIMMVGVSYAWISISIAPEAKTIQTTVGGNGALEIALQSTATTATGTYVKAPIGSGRGDSSDVENKSKLVSNITWGNIVDVSDGYGLDAIQLRPARLNLLISGNSVQVNTQYPLVVPEYGTDGRIAVMNNAPKAHYNNEYRVFEDTANWGVNVIGFKQELNDTQSQSITRSVSRDSIRSEAARNIYEYRNSIRNGLIQSIEDESDDIFGVINKTMLVFMNRAVYSWSVEDGECVKNIADALMQAAVESDTAIRWAFLAYCVSDSSHYDADNPEQMSELGRIYKQFLTMPLIPGQNDTSSFNIRSLAVTNGYTSLVTAIDAIQQVKMRVAVAKDYLKDGSTSQIGNAGACIISVTGSYIMNKGSTPNQVFYLKGQSLDTSAQTRKGYYHNLRVGNTEDTFYFVGSNSVTTDGLFQAMARVVGDYTAVLTSSFSVPLVAPTVKTYTYNLKVTSKNTNSLNQYNESNNVGTLGQIYNAVSELQTSGTIPLEIEHFGVTAYGYSIDLAFKSNERGLLLLEDDAANRITGQTVQQSDEPNELLQGGGSTFLFTRAFDITDDQVQATLDCIYIVFTMSDGQILAVAKPYDPVFRGTQVSGKLKLFNVNYAQTVQNGILTLGSEIANNSITALQKNRETDITAIVYLDGDNIHSASLSATMGFTLYGSINLQFASSARLSPIANYTKN